MLFGGRMNLAAPRVVNIKDLRRLARRRLPDAVFDYLDGAADDEVTLKDSERAFKEVIFKPRHAVATPSCDLSVTVLERPDAALAGRLSAAMSACT